MNGWSELEMDVESRWASLGVCLSFRKSLRKKPSVFAGPRGRKWETRGREKTELLTLLINVRYCLLLLVSPYMCAWSRNGTQTLGGYILSLSLQSFLIMSLSLCLWELWHASTLEILASVFFTSSCRGHVHKPVLSSNCPSFYVCPG